LGNAKSVLYLDFLLLLFCFIFYIQRENVLYKLMYSNLILKDKFNYLRIKVVKRCCILNSSLDEDHAFLLFHNHFRFYFLCWITKMNEEKVFYIHGDS
jgi:hypothetical protein